MAASWVGDILCRATERAVASLDGIARHGRTLLRNLPLELLPVWTLASHKLVVPKNGVVILSRNAEARKIATRQPIVVAKDIDSSVRRKTREHVSDGRRAVALWGACPQHSRQNRSDKCVRTRDRRVRRERDPLDAGAVVWMGWERWRRSLPRTTRITVDCLLCTRRRAVQCTAGVGGPEVVELTGCLCSAAGAAGVGTSGVRKANHVAAGVVLARRVVERALAKVQARLALVVEPRRHRIVRDRHSEQPGGEQQGGYGPPPHAHLTQHFSLAPAHVKMLCTLASRLCSRLIIAINNCPGAEKCVLPTQLASWRGCWRRTNKIFHTARATCSIETYAARPSKNQMRAHIKGRIA